MKVQGNRALVTGGAGLVGSHIVDMLIKKQAREVMALGQFSRGQPKNLSWAMAHWQCPHLPRGYRESDSTRKSNGRKIAYSTRRQFESPNARRTRVSPWMSWRREPLKCSKPQPMRRSRKSLPLHPHRSMAWLKNFQLPNPIPLITTGRSMVQRRPSMRVSCDAFMICTD